MKLAPVALAYANHPQEAVARVADSARTTHGARQAIDASRHLAGLLVGALNGAGRDELLGGPAFEPVAGLWEREPLHPEIAEVASGSFRVKEPPAIEGANYVVRALEAALWAAARSESFEEGVLRAVNLGEGADTTAAIYGQLTGAIYGVDAIPLRWRERLVMRERIEELADELHELSSRIGAPGG
jgi:ADP-ribosylglycohydrolase